MDDNYLTPANIIPKLPKNFDELLASKKWQERKEALDTLGTILAENPKLDENLATHRHIMEKLNEILAADSNINCAAQSAKCLAQFAKGLRAKFAPLCPLLAPTVFDKFREKKAIMREPLIELADSLYSTSNLSSLAPAILEAFGKKLNPSQKAQIDQFLWRIFRSPISPKYPKELLRDLITTLSEHACDPDPDVRDSAFAALGAIQMCVGEKVLSTLLSGAVTGDAAKMAKITEYKEKAALEAAALAKSSLDAQSAPQSDGTANNSDGQQQQNGHEQLAAVDGQRPQIDPWDLLNPVDILPKMPANFDELMASKKWQERKTALDGLTTILIDNPRLEENADYRQIVEKLDKSLATDSNINCAAQSAKCLAQFAKGLRSKFAPFCPLLAPTVFDKFKEKKAILRDPLIGLSDSLYSSSNLSSLAPAILEAFGKKLNPSQKAQIDQFLWRIFRSPISPKCPKELLRDLITTLSEHACDPDPDVRDSAFAALGAIQMCVGEKVLSTLLSGAVTGDAAKMAKIAEYKEKAGLGTAALAKSAAPSAPAPPEAANRPPPPPPHQTAPATKPANEQKEMPAQQQPAAGKIEAEHESDVANDSTTMQTPKSATVSEIINNQQQQQAAMAVPKVEPRNPLDPVDLITKLPKELEEQLASKKWQERQVALDSLATALAEYQRLVDNPDYRPLIEHLTKILATEMNTTRAALAALCLTGFARGLRNRFGLYAATVAPVVFEKFKEKKADLRGPLVELIDAIFASTNLTNLAQTILEAATKPNPNQKAQLDQFLYRVFRFLPAKDIPKGFVKDVVTFLSDHVFNSDPDVRDSAFAALGAIMKCAGEKMVMIYLNNKIISDAAKMAKIAEYRERAYNDVQSIPNGNATAQNSGGHPARARSASGTRHVAPQLPNDSVMSSKTDESTTTTRTDRRSHAGTGLSSAKSHASALNTTLASMPSGGLFQLHPKFFENDFDEPTLTMNSPTTTNANGKSALNTTLTLAKAGPAERGTLARNGGGGGPSITNFDQQDMQPIKPVVRPTSTFSRRSESVSSISSLESAEHIDRAVHNVSSLQLNIAEEAIAQLLHLLNDPSNRQYLTERVELILREIVTQIFHIRGTHLEQLEAAKEADGGDGAVPSPRTAAKEAELGEFMRSICNFLTSLTKEPTMMQKVITDPLRAFMDAILSLVNDQRLKNLNSQIFRSLNIVVIRLCDFTNPNSCFVALMKLTTKYQQQQQTEGGHKMIELVRKCLIKHCDVLAEPERVAQIDLPTVLEPIHQYYSRFYVLNEKGEVEEQAKQTAKVLCIYLQRLVVHKRYSILNHLYQFPDNSHLVSYVRRCVRAAGKRAAEDKTPDGHAPMPEELERLFGQINEDDLFGGAVEDLYNLMDIHPEQNVNFEQLMAQCDYAPIVRKAFNEIRQCRLRREPVLAGFCVRKVLPDETRQFLDHHRQFETRLEELIGKLQLTNGKSPTGTVAQSGGGSRGGGGGGTSSSQKSTPTS